MSQPQNRTSKAHQKTTQATHRLALFYITLTTLFIAQIGTPHPLIQCCHVSIYTNATLMLITHHKDLPPCVEKQQSLWPKRSRARKEDGCMLLTYLQQPNIHVRLQQQKSITQHQQHATQHQVTKVRSSNPKARWSPLYSPRSLQTICHSAHTENTIRKATPTTDQMTSEREEATPRARTKQATPTRRQLTNANTAPRQHQINPAGTRPLYLRHGERPPTRELIRNPALYITKTRHSHPETQKKNRPEIRISQASNRIKKYRSIHNTSIQKWFRHKNGYLRHTKNRQTKQPEIRISCPTTYCGQKPSTYGRRSTKIR